MPVGECTFVRFQSSLLPIDYWSCLESVRDSSDDFD